MFISDTGSLQATEQSCLKVIGTGSLSVTVTGSLQATERVSLPVIATSSLSVTLALYKRQNKAV